MGLTQLQKLLEVDRISQSYIKRVQTHTSNLSLEKLVVTYNITFIKKIKIGSDIYPIKHIHRLQPPLNKF